MMGYRKTGNKMMISFHGSKGYLSYAAIRCEGYQRGEENIIWIEKLTNKDGSLKQKMVNIFHSEENGIRISLGKDKPRLVPLSEERLMELEAGSDLPF